MVQLDISVSYNFSIICYIRKVFLVLVFLNLQISLACKTRRWYTNFCATNEQKQQKTNLFSVHWLFWLFFDFLLCYPGFYCHFNPISLENLRWIAVHNAVSNDRSRRSEMISRLGTPITANRWQPGEWRHTRVVNATPTAILGVRL